MKNLKYITNFVFDKAQYEISDRNGNFGLLKIDYKNNKYDFKTVQKSIKLIKEADRVAKDLLKRKHGVNFANK